MLSISADFMEKFRQKFLEFVASWKWNNLNFNILAGDVVRLGAVVISAGAIGWYLGHKGQLHQSIDESISKSIIDELSGYLGRYCGDMTVNQTVMKDTPKVFHSQLIEKSRSIH